MLQPNGEGDYWYDSAYLNLSLTQADRTALIDAIRQDIAEGHLRVGDARDDDYANNLCLTFADPENSGPENGNYDFRSLTLNASCTHTLEVLERSPDFDRENLITLRELRQVETGMVMPPAEEIAEAEETSNINMD